MRLPRLVSALLVLAVLCAPALALADPPFVVVEAGAVRVNAEPYTGERVECPARAPDDVDGRIGPFEERLVGIRQWYAARGEAPQRLEVRVAREAPLELVRRVLHTLDVAGLPRTEPALDGAPLFPATTALPSCRARPKTCASPRVEVSAEGLRAVLQYGTAQGRRACEARGKPGPEQAPSWAGRRIPAADAPPIPPDQLVGALRGMKGVQACPRALVRLSATATAGALVDALKALEGAGYREVVVE